MGTRRARRVFWAAIAAVVACALVVGWCVFGLVARPLPSEPVQASVSPDGRWEVRTWFAGSGRLGRSDGVLRVEVTDLAARRAAPRTIYADPVGNRDAARRYLMWRDATHLVLPLAGGEEVVLDVARAPTQSTPGEFSALLKATAVATACLVTVLVAGVVAVLLANTWLARRATARWEAWPVDWSEGRRRAPQG